MIDLILLAIFLGVLAAAWIGSGNDPRTKAGRKRGRISRENQP